MKLFFNPNPFASFSLRGLDIAAYSNSTGAYRSDASSCYVDSSASPTIQIYQCQMHNDYVYDSQLDNTITVGNYYAVGVFRCGDGQVVRCATGDCSESCRILKGKGVASADGGVFSLRRVKFKQGYQSPVLANKNVLDFVIGFYQGGQLISASLINAYTLKSKRLEYLTLRYYNIYLSSTHWNLGERIPTLLSLSGHISLAEGFDYDGLKLFLPPHVTAKRYIEQDRRLGCSYACTGEEYSLAATITGWKDNWLGK